MITLGVAPSEKPRLRLTGAGADSDSTPSGRGGAALGLIPGHKREADESHKSQHSKRRSSDATSSTLMELQAKAKKGCDAAKEAVTSIGRGPARAVGFSMAAQDGGNRLLDTCLVLSTCARDTFFR